MCGDGLIRGSLGYENFAIEDVIETPRQQIGNMKIGFDEGLERKIIETR